MIKKTITYTDYNGNERTEDFYFNLSKAEVVELEVSTNGSLIQTIEKIVAEQDREKIVEIFKDLILTAYGEKSLDGKKFVKNQELRDSFSQTEAYVELFMELATNEAAAVAFVNGIIPASVSADALSKTTTAN